MSCYMMLVPFVYGFTVSNTSIDGWYTVAFFLHLFKALSHDTAIIFVLIIFRSLEIVYFQLAYRKYFWYLTNTHLNQIQFVTTKFREKWEKNIFWKGHLFHCRFSISIQLLKLVIERYHQQWYSYGGGVLGSNLGGKPTIDEMYFWKKNWKHISSSPDWTTISIHCVVDIFCMY